MTGYPVMLNIAGRTCVVVGGGHVGARKARSLLEADARVVIISPILDPGFTDLTTHPNLTWIEANYDLSVLAAHKPFLIFAATDSPAVNSTIAADARQLGALVNVADQSVSDDFDNMSVIQRPPITIGISSGGTSPALARLLRSQIEQVIEEEYVTLSHWLSDLRPQIQSSFESQPQRQQFYQSVLQSDVLQLLHEGQTDAAYTKLQSLVKERVG
jgi:precorrin-2 dehydrogenase/sirohydrochlorin ferrochelatase